LLEDLGIRVRMHDLPNELPDPTLFGRDRTHAVWDAGYAHRLSQVLVQADRVFKAVRARFPGKCSRVSLFWGGNDLAVTRLSTPPAPLHPGGIAQHLPDAVTREATNQGQRRGILVRRSPDRPCRLSCLCGIRCLLQSGHLRLSWC
jgi:hypothetical protein